MNRRLSEIAAALDRVAEAMDAETAAVRSGESNELTDATERKRIVIEAAETVLRQAESMTHAAGGGAERNRIEHAVHRMQAAVTRNATTLQGALEASRRLFSCLAEAAQQASSTGTYAPDGSRQRTAETVGTIHRSA